MSDNVLPSVSTFNIGEVLQGRGYPEVEVSVFLDEAAAISIARDEKRLTQFALLGRTEEHDKLDLELAGRKEALRAQRYVFHLRGIPNKVRQNLLDKAFEKFPRKRDFIGTEEPSDERDDFFTTLLWQATVTRITDPNGAVQINPSIETIQQIRDYAPIAALDAIAAGINELTLGAKAGFEAAAQDTDFLSQP